MNDRSYLTVERDVAQRRRRLNALAGAQLGGLITMTLTLAHLLAVYLGLMALVQPWWALVVVNALGLAIGVQWGRRRPVNVQGDLYRLDRAYALGEKLTTIHEIRKRDDRNPYLRLLYQRVGPTELSPKRALRASRRQRQGWATFGAVTCVSVALLVMWFVGVPPLSVSSLFAYGTDDGRPFAASQTSSDSTQASARGQGAPNPQSQAPGGAEDRSASPCGDDAGRSPSLLTRDERSDCDDSNPSSDSDDASDGSQATSQGSSESEDARMSVQQLRRELENVQRQMASGSLSSEDARRELERLAQQARTPSIEELLRQAARSQAPSEIQQRLREALDELRRQSEQAQQGSGQRGLDPDADLQRRSDQRTDGNANGSGRGQTEGQDRPTEEGTDEAQRGQNDPDADGRPEAQRGDGPQRSGSGSGPNEGEDGAASENAESGTTSESGDEGSEPDGQGQSESGPAQSGDQASSEAAQGSQPGETGTQGERDQGEESGGSSQQSSSDTEGESDSAENARPDSQAEGEQEGAGSPGGSSPGTGPGDNRGGQGPDPDGRTSNDLRVQAPNLPGDIETLRALMTKGVPFDVSGDSSADGAPRLELNPDRVETLLRSRDLPPALRDLVRAYFLSLAEGE